MSMRVRWMSGRVAQDIRSLDQQALDITVHNASMMSSFTNVIALSREQTGILADADRDSMSWPIRWLSPLCVRAASVI